MQVGHTHRHTHLFWHHSAAFNALHFQNVIMSCTLSKCYVLCDHACFEASLILDLSSSAFKYHKESSVSHNFSPQLYWVTGGGNGKTRLVEGEKCTWDYFGTLKVSGDHLIFYTFLSGGDRELRCSYRNELFSASDFPSNQWNTP